MLAWRRWPKPWLVRQLSTCLAQLLRGSPRCLKTAINKNGAKMDNGFKIGARALCSVSCYGLQLNFYDKLDSVKALWVDFEKAALLTPFQTTAWLYHWYEHIGALEKVQPLVVVAEDKEGVLFVLPLQIETGVLRRLSWLGSDLNDYNGPLIAANYTARATDFVMQDVWRKLLLTLNGQDHLQQDYVRLEKMASLICGQPNPMLALGTTLAASHAYRTPMVGGWDAFYATKRDGKNRYKDRSARKKLEELGPVTLESPEDRVSIRSVVDTLINQKSARFEQKGISNFLLNPGHVEFYRAIAEFQRDLVHVSQLIVGKTVASTNLGLRFRGAYYYVLNSFAIGETDRFGSGKVHMRDLMKMHIEKGFEAFDFTIGDEPYKLEWCDTKTPLYDHMDASTMKGRAAIAYWSAFQSTKRYIKQTPALWDAYAKMRGALAPRKRA